MNKVIAITGQTASGKTKLALKYSRELNGELINCDSRQIYKGLTIVTGKDLTDPDYHEVTVTDGLSIGYYLLETTKIWLYDIIAPNSYFSSHQYAVLARETIHKILQAGKTPIIVGGTYFYLKHLLYGSAEDQGSPDPRLRSELNQLSLVELRKMLTEIDPDYYNDLNDSDRKNPRRLIRKIEIAKTQPRTSAFSEPFELTLPAVLNVPDLTVEIFGVKYQHKDNLVDTIKTRVDSRLQQGAVEEIAALRKSGYTLNDPGMKTIGCRQLYTYLEGNSTLEQARDEWILRELQYAKRQETFMKKDPHIKWRFMA